MFVISAGTSLDSEERCGDGQGSGAVWVVLVVLCEPVVLCVVSVVLFVFCLVCIGVDVRFVLRDALARLGLQSGVLFVLSNVLSGSSGECIGPDVCCVGLFSGVRNSGGTLIVACRIICPLRDPVV